MKFSYKKFSFPIAHQLNAFSTDYSLCDTISCMELSFSCLKMKFPCMKMPKSFMDENSLYELYTAQHYP